MKKFLAMALAVIMTCGVMTACGSDDSSEKKTTTTEATTTTTTTAATTTTTAETTTTPAETEAPTPDEPEYAINVGVSYNEPYTTTVPDGMTKATITFVPLLGETATDVGWNDYCTFKITVTNTDGTKNYGAVVGASVSWDVTVDDMGTPDDTTDNVIIKAADAGVMWTDENLDYTIDVTGGATLEVTALGWNDSEETSAIPYFVVGDIVYE